MSAAPDRLVASERRIDLWLAYYDRIDDEPLLARLHALLDETERQQQRRFLFADDRKRYLVTRALVRTVLSRYAPVAPRDWTFSKNGYGRPEIAATHTDAAGLCFNLSHSRGLVVLGVTAGAALGVDVENTRVRQVSEGIAERFFAPSEAAALARIPPEQQQERFFEYWTFKESYIKARGMGLSIPLDRFSFDYPHADAVRLSVLPGLDDDPGRWRFWQCRPSTEHLLAVCAERVAAEAPILSLRRIVPTVGDEALDVVLLRTS
jgi:4'-phosphopantetheinyl transferase